MAEAFTLRTLDDRTRPPAPAHLRPTSSSSPCHPMAALSTPSVSRRTRPAALQMGTNCIPSR
jgi:hypothetical protein